ncbi:MAG: FtsX-like permease family protein [Candidatus Bathyarchaeota archaeon]|nr:FtsX-like permease family protein [Candidatus Bathyarchaeota archaeon]
MMPHVYAFREMRRRKFRTVTNVLGFVLVVATLIALVSAAQGWESTTATPLKDIGTDLILIYSAPVVPSGTGCYIANHLFSFPFNQSIIDEIAQVDGVENSVPVLMHRMGAIVFTGIDPTHTQTNAVLPRDIVEGRFLTQNDGAAALVDNEYAQLNNLTVGSNVAYMKGKYEIVGLVNVDAANILKSHIYVNLPVGQKSLPEDSTGLVNVALISVDDPRDVDQVSDELAGRWLGATPIAASDLAAKTSEVITIGEETAWYISIAVAVVAVLFTVRSQVSAVSERTREIGILKAIGWSSGDVVSQIFIESALQGVIGGVVGCIAGYGVAWYFLSTTAGSTAVVDPTVLLVGFTVALLSGIVAGLYPSWKAARLTPAQALRTI